MNASPAQTFGLSSQALATLQSALRACSPVERAILYGSRAMGSFKPGSDIDLTLEGPQLSDSDLLHLAGNLAESDLPYQVDLSILNQIDNAKLLEHIRRVGQVLYQR